MKSVPEGTTRVAMLKKGEVDIAYALDGEDARDTCGAIPQLAARPSQHASIYWIEFAGAVGSEIAVGRQAGAAGGQSTRWTARPSTRWRASASARPPAIIVPRVMDFALQTPAARL